MLGSDEVAEALDAFPFWVFLEDVQVGNEYRRGSRMAGGAVYQHFTIFLVDHIIEILGRQVDSLGLNLSVQGAIIDWQILGEIDFLFF